MTPVGLTICTSAFDPAETMERLVKAVTGRGMTIFARIDHAAGAAQDGMELGPTAVLIFGSAQTGTPLIRLRRTLGIDLPLKALVWQDEAARTQLAYNDPTWLAARHGADAGAEKTLAAMTAVLAAVALEATVKGA